MSNPTFGPINPGQIITVDAKSLHTVTIDGNLRVTGSINPGDTRDFRAVTSATDLDHAVFKTPINTLVALWLAKYGGDWVRKDTVLDDEFFEWAALRLRQAGKLEEHQIWEDEQMLKRVTMVRVVD